MKYTDLLLVLLLLAGSHTLSAQTTVTYQTTIEDFPNPERGFYRATGTHVSNFGPLNPTDTENYRDAQIPFEANHSVRSTLVFRYFVLDDFKDRPISASILQLIDNDFDVIRNAGMKIIPRFTYINSTSEGDCGDFTCPPYGDAPKNIVLNHISQLAPILQRHADVIATVQMGFIGIWGENYYTDFFGYAGAPPEYSLTDQNWNDRNEVLAALLAAVPANRTVQVRYPQIKQRFVYGVDAPTTAAPLTAAEAYAGTDKSRIGFHNDCFMASFSDFGTYVDYGNDSTPSNDDTTNLRAYYAADSRYVPVGGETCWDGYSPQNDCDATSPLAYTESDLERMHFSFLNADYNVDVNNDWQTGGCLNDIKRRLGYRFELQSATFPDQVASGGTLSLSLSLANTGYAAPYNVRDVQLLLREKSSGEVWRAALAEDPRRWWPGSVTNLNLAACLPPTLAEGDYEVFLNLPDPAPSLAGRPDYSIRLANRLPDGRNVWEPTTGFNRLGHVLTVTAGTPGCTAAVTFAPDNQQLPVDFRYFTATPTAKTIDLRWQLASADNFSHYELERSTDGITFVQLANVSAGEDELAPHAFIDRTVSPGVTYFYRNRAVDHDGSATYAPLATASITAAAATPVLFPNPTTGVVRLSWPAGVPETGDIRVYDALGRLRLRTLPTDEFSLSHLPRGVYTVVVAGRGQRLVLR